MLPRNEEKQLPDEFVWVLPDEIFDLALIQTRSTAKEAEWSKVARRTIS